MSLARSLVTWFKRQNPRHMIVLAIGVGLLGGYGAVGFRHLIQLLQRMWPGEGWNVERIASLRWYWIVGIPAAGGLIVGAITRWFAPEAKGHGVPEVMEAVALRGGRIRPRVVAAKAVASGVCIASGGSVGREGPIVQIGAAIGSTFGQLLGMEPRKMRTLVGCGAAAGIAATFNAPIAGALFAVEVVLGDFAVHQFSPIVLSSVMATVVSRHYLGNVPAFEIPAAQIESFRLVHPVELIVYAGLGILAGILALGFVRTLCFAEDRFDAMPLTLPLRAAIGGAAVGAIALLYPDVLGVGYGGIGRVLMESPSARLLAGLLIAKLLAICLTLGSGGSGGVFAPSLFLGAMLGGLVGAAVHHFFPGQTAPPGAYALVGMGAVVAATTHAPLTTILIVFELTSDYRIMLPLMTAAIISTQFVQRFSAHSIYTIKLARRGVMLRAGQEINLLRSVKVREVMIVEPPVIAPAAVLRSLVTRFTSEDSRCFYVVDADGRLSGVISLRELRPVLGDVDSLGSTIVAADIAAREFPRVSIEDSLDSVLQRLDADYRDELPVLDGERMVGIVRIEDVLARYRHEVAKREMAEETGPGATNA